MFPRFGVLFFEVSVLKELVVPIFENAFERARAAGDLTSEEMPAVVIETPPNEAFGDFSCNIAMTWPGQRASAL